VIPVLATAILAVVGDLKPFVVTGLALGAVYALSGIGIVVLYQATGVLNFSYGTTGAIGALVAWDLTDRGLAPGVGWVTCLAVSVLLAVTYGELVAAKVDRRDEAVKAIATLGFALMLLGFAFAAWSDSDRSLTLPTDSSGATVFGVRIVGTQFAAVVLACLVTGGVTLLLRRSRIGLTMRAMADDGELSALLGVRVGRVRRLSWAISGLLAGVSGLLVADLVRLDASTLTFLVIPGVAAAIIGGLRSLGVTLAAGLGLGVVEAVGAPFAGISSYRGIAPFAVAVLFLFLRSPRTTLASV
jgi:branched-chain amino acid transport system permease protein